MILIFFNFKFMSYEQIRIERIPRDQWRKILQVYTKILINETDKILTRYKILARLKKNKQKEER